MVKRIRAWDEDFGYGYEEFKEILKDIKRCNSLQEALEVVDPKHDHPYAKQLSNICSLYRAFLDGLVENDCILKCHRNLETELSEYAYDLFSEVLSDNFSDEQCDDIISEVYKLSIIDF